MLPTLYGKDKNNKTCEWTIFIQKDEIIILHGIYCKGQKRIQKTIKGKNIGKTNETTAEKQALIKANLMWEKKKKKGYFEFIEEVNNED